MLLCRVTWANQWTESAKYTGRGGRKVDSQHSEGYTHNIIVLASHQCAPHHRGDTMAGTPHWHQEDQTDQTRILFRMDTETKGTSSDIVCTTIHYLYPHTHMKVLKIVLFDEHFITKLLHEIVIDVSRYTPAILLNTYHTVYCKPLIRKLLYWD